MFKLPPAWSRAEAVARAASCPACTIVPAMFTPGGAKFPMGRSFAFRPELNYAHVWTDGPADDTDNIQLLLGLSVFTQ